MKYPEILEIQPEPATFSYDENFTILYALGIGLGAVPEELDYVYEKRLRVFPTMAIMLGQGAGDFLDKGGIDYTRIVHGEQRLTIHAPLPPTGTMVSTSRCLGVADKGKDKGALINIESTTRDAATGTLHATAVSTLMCRGDGGFGGPAGGELPLRPIPDRPHDSEVTIQTLPQQAAIYRLSGDRNPLHIDPERATAVGFPGPILHGLCSYAIAARALSQACCDGDPDRIEHIAARFSSPVYPGEAVTAKVWRDGNDISFECVIAERGVTVIKNGYCRLRG